MLAIDDRRGSDLPPVSLNLGRHVLWTTDVDAEKTALVVMHVSGAEHWSYARLRESVLAMAGGLLESGLQPGNKLLMRIGNTPDFPIVFLAAIAVGIIPVPTSAALTTSEVTKMCAVLTPDAIVCAGAVALPDDATNVLTPDDLRKTQPLDQIAATAADDPAYIVFTSGTSGTPTGVVHAHRAIWARRAMIAGWTGLTRDDRLLHAGAFNWTYTLGTGLLDPWSLGATALVLGDGFSPEDIPALAKQYEATILAGAPGVFRRLLRTQLPALPKLRHALSAGEKLPESLRASWKSTAGTDIHEAFGQSECSTFLSGSPDRPAPSGTVGYVQPGRAASVLGEDGPANRGELGRIAVHRSDPGMMLGYLNDGGLSDQEWIPTGDLGLMREDGSVETHGRADDVLTAGGFRISPIEIEEVMLSHQLVTEAAAIDCLLDETTRVIKLYFTSDADIDEADLRHHAAQSLARHKCPRIFERIDQMPRNPNGKLLRKSLRAANETK